MNPTFSILLKCSNALYTKQQSMGTLYLPEHNVKVCSNIKVSEDEVMGVSKGIFHSCCSSNNSVELPPQC